MLAQVGSVADAVEALEAGVDGLIAQGREAGGHGLRSELASGTLPLASRLVTLASSPEYQRVVVLAAGGITDGRGLAAALALGCDGAVMGTRLWACRESIGDPALQASLLSADADDVVRTGVFDSIMNSYSAHPWPEPFDSVGVLKNVTWHTWHNRSRQGRRFGRNAGSNGPDDELLASSAAYKAAVRAGDPTVAGVWSGEGVGEVTEIEGAESVVRSAEVECIRQVDMLSSRIVRTGAVAGEPTSRL